MKASSVLRHSTSNTPKWIQYLGIAAAGILTFSAAFYFNSGSNDAVVLPREKHSKQASDSASVVNAVEHSEFPPLNLSAAVVQNPFGPLNLAADVTPPPIVVFADANRGRTSKKRSSDKKHPVEAPPVMAVAAPPPPPPPPQAPVLPFKAIGTLQGPQVANGQQVVFLKAADYLVAARVGDEIDKTYRVEKITDTRVDLLYLPLKKTQSLSIAP